MEIDGLKSVAPAGWKPQEPDPKLGKFRILQFALPKADGDKEDGELVVFFFGPGGGGGNAENIKRWKGMFAAPPGKMIDDVTKVDSFKVGDVDITYVEISGTYLTKFPPFAPNAKVVPKENFRFIGVIFDSKNGPYFLRLTGPATHHRAKQGRLRQMAQGLQIRRSSFSGRSRAGRQGPAAEAISHDCISIRLHPAAPPDRPGAGGARDHARLLVVRRRRDDSLAHHRFDDLANLLIPGDLLVLNDTRVMPARLLGKRAATGGKWEGLFLRQFPDGTWEMLCQTRGRLQPGEQISY